MIALIHFFYYKSNINKMNLSLLLACILLEVLVRVQATSISILSRPLVLILSLVLMPLQLVRLLLLLTQLLWTILWD